MKYLTRRVVEEIHRTVILETPGRVPERPHILNPDMLELALDLPKQHLYGKELYPDLFEKAAVLMRELIRGHVFEAANKRTGYMCALTFLDENGYILSSSVEEAESITTRIATGEADIEEIAEWLRKHSKKRKDNTQ